MYGRHSVRNQLQMEILILNLMDSSGMHSEFYVEDFVNVCKRCSGMQKMEIEK